LGLLERSPFPTAPIAWLAVAALGLALWHLDLLSSPSPALHALTVGAMAGLILAMIARLSLGHTGRDLVAPKALALALALPVPGTLARGFFPRGLGRRSPKAAPG